MEISLGAVSLKQHPDIYHTSHFLCPSPPPLPAPPPSPFTVRRCCARCKDNGTQYGISMAQIHNYTFYAPPMMKYYTIIIQHSDPKDLSFCSPSNRLIGKR